MENLTLFVTIVTFVFAGMYSYILEKIDAFHALTFWGKWAVIVGGNAVIAIALVADACYLGVLEVVLNAVFGASAVCPTNVAGTMIAVTLLSIFASQTFHNLYNRKRK